MDDQHIIRVIIQGYNQLSGVLKDAVDKSTPQLDKLNDKLRRNKTEADNASASWVKVGDSTEKNSTQLDRAGSIIDRFVQRIKNLNKQTKEYSETSADMFDRLRKEGNAPRVGTGFSPFVSKSDFVAQEDARRAQEQQGILARAAQTKRKVFQGFSPLDDIVRGFQQGNQRTPGPEGISARIQFEMEEKLAKLRQEQNDALAKADEAAARRRKDAQDASVKEATRLRELLALEDKRLDAARQKLELDTRNYRIQRQTEASEALKRVSGTDSEAVASKVKIKQDTATELAASEAALKQQIRTIEQERSTLHRETMSQIEQEKEAQLNSARSVATENKNKIKETFSERNRIIRDSARDERANIPNAIVKADQDAKEAISNIGGFVERTSAKAGKSVKDFTDSFRGARKGLRDFQGDALAARNSVSQIGAAFGNATRDINQFVNIRWFFMIGLMQSFLTIAIQLGAALVAIGSSAVMAGAALGGALLTGLGAAIPVVGVLVAGFHQIQNALKVVDLRQKANNSSSQDATAQAKAQKEAVQSLADAHYNLKQAQQGVADADRNIRNAHEKVTDSIKEERDSVKALAIARRDAARAIVDAALNERDAELSLKDAELGVLDAKQKLKAFEDKSKADKSALKDAQAAVREAQDRLKAAQQQGDQVEIAGAKESLSVAQSNVNNLKDQLAQVSQEHQQLQLSVKQAQLAQERARVNLPRAQQDLAERKRLGVKNDPGVKAAEDQQKKATRAYRDAVEGVSAAERQRSDAVHSVAIAMRGVKNSQDDVIAASDKMSAAQRNAQREFNKLSLPERKFVLAAERLKKAWNKAVRPITDILVGAVTRGVDGAVKILNDPKIQKGFEGIAKEVADVADHFTKWAVSPEGRKTILFFIGEARKNLPKIADAAGKLAGALLRISKAASPIFDGIIDGLDSLAGKFDKTTKNSKGLSKFFADAGKHLHAWGELTKAVLNFFAALVGGAAPEGLSMVQELTDAFNGWADSMRKHPERVREFFKRIHDSLKELLPVIGRFIGQLVKAFTSKEFTNFTVFVLQTMIPALLTLVGVIGKFTALLDFFTHIWGIGPIVGWLIKIALVYGALSRLFPLVKAFKEAFSIKRFLIIFALYEIATHFDQISAAIKRLKKWFDGLPGWMKPIVALLGGGVAGVGLAGSLLLTVKRFGTLSSIILKLGGKSGAFEQLALQLTGAGGARGIVGLMGKAGLAGAAALAGYQIGKLLLKIPGVKNAMKGLGEAVGRVLEKIPGGKTVEGFLTGAHGDARGDALGDASSAQILYVQGAYKKLRNGGMTHQQALDALNNRFPKLGKDKISAMIPSSFEKRQSFAKGGVVQPQSFALGGAVKSAVGSAVPIIAHAGEWVLNKTQQAKLSRRLGMSADALRMVLFGSQGASPIAGTVSGRSVSEHGQWQGYHNFDVNTTTDDDGNAVNFIRFKDGTWGQVTGKAAQRIADTQGSWLPGYVKRSASIHGGLFETQRKKAAKVIGGLRTDAFDRRFANGGVVSFAAPGAGSYAAGGVISGPQVYSPSSKKVEQHNTFHVKTEGDTDWSYVWRLGAQITQESF